MAVIWNITQSFLPGGSLPEAKAVDDIRDCFFAIRH
jgi:hypothetical protein